VWLELPGWTGCVQSEGVDALVVVVPPAPGTACLSLRVAHAVLGGPWHPLYHVTQLASPSIAATTDFVLGDVELVVVAALQLGASDAAVRGGRGVREGCVVLCVGDLSMLVDTCECLWCMCVCVCVVVVVVVVCVCVCVGGGLGIIQRG
jgi:hypothetical protein